MEEFTFGGKLIPSFIVRKNAESIVQKAIAKRKARNRRKAKRRRK